VIFAHPIAGSTRLTFKVEAKAVDMWATRSVARSCPHIHSLYDDYGLSSRLRRQIRVEKRDRSGSIIF
jgi:hypothetical protein